MEATTFGTSPSPTTPENHALADGLVPTLDAARDSLANFNQRALALARQHPVAFLVGALTAGFVLGKLASRL